MLGHGGNKEAAELRKKPADELTDVNKENLRINKYFPDDMKISTAQKVAKVFLKQKEPNADSGIKHGYAEYVANLGKPKN